MYCICVWMYQLQLMKLFQQQVLSQVQLKKRLEAISRILGFIMRRSSNVWSKVGFSLLPFCWTWEEVPKMSDLVLHPTGIPMFDHIRLSVMCTCLQWSWSRRKKRLKIASSWPLHPMNHDPLVIRYYWPSPWNVLWWGSVTSDPEIMATFVMALLTLAPLPTSHTHVRKSSKSIFTRKKNLYCHFESHPGESFREICCVNKFFHLHRWLIKDSCHGPCQGVGEWVGG